MMMMMVMVIVTVIVVVVVVMMMIVLLLMVMMIAQIRVMMALMMPTHTIIQRARNRFVPIIRPIPRTIWLCPKRWPYH